MTVVGEKLYYAMRDPGVRIILMPGSSRSSKTYSIMQNLHIAMCEKPGTRVTAWRQSLTWARVSIIDDWKRKFLQPDIYNMYNSVESPRPVWTLKKGGSSIEFSGLEDYQKVHGVASDIIWINEGIEARQESVRQLLQRLGDGKMIIDYNPSEDEHFLYDYALREDCRVIHSTFRDNPFLHPSTVREIESYEDTPENRKRGTVSEYHWKVYGLGMPAKKSGLVFPDWEYIDEWPEDAKLLGYGIDFGFNDPAACGRMGLYDGKLILDEIFYKSGLNNVDVYGSNYPSIEGELRSHGITSEKIIGDSAAKTAINELKSCGFNISPVKKYPGSIEDGILLMNNFKPFLVTKRSINTVKELNNYIYPEKGGKMPIDSFNHLMDMYRYVALTYLKNRKRKLKFKVL